MKKFILFCLVAFVGVSVYAKYYEVIKGDTLWNIADTFYKNPFLWKKIFDINIDKIKNPNLIYPGQIFIIPELTKDISSKEQQTDTIHDVNEKKISEQTDFENNDFYNKDDVGKEIIFDETNILGKIVNNKKNKLFYVDGDSLYFSLSKSVKITEGEVFYIFHKGPSKYDVSLQNIKNDEIVIVGKARVKNVRDKIVELYLIRAYSPIVEGDFVVR